MNLGDLALLPRHLIKHISKTGLVPIDDISFVEWSGGLDKLRDIELAHQWWIADWVNIGKSAFPQTWQQAFPVPIGADSDVRSQTLYNWASIAHKFPPETRHPNLSFTHHAEVAWIKDPDERERLLCIAEERGLSTSGLRQLVRTLKAETRAVLDEEEKDAAYSEQFPPPSLLAIESINIAKSAPAIIAVSKELSLREIEQIEIELHAHRMSWGVEELRITEGAEIVLEKPRPEKALLEHLEAALPLMKEIQAPVSYLETTRKQIKWVERVIFESEGI